MKQQSPYYFHPQFIFRTPLIPLQKNKIDAIELFHYSQQLFFKEAIYLASPVLHDELVKWHNGELKVQKEIDKIVLSVYKYYSRMQSRCTPFGLFAACATGKWSDKNEFIIDDFTKRHTRLDMNYLCALAQQLNSHPVISPLLLFYPNSSIYVFGRQLRYVEYHYINNRRVHQISSVDYSDYLKKLLDRANSGASINDLVALLTSDNIAHEEAIGFVKELIDSQILVSELEPAVTGDEFIYQIINTLKKLNAKDNNQEIDAIIQLLSTTQQKISDIDKHIGNNTEAYRIIYQELEALKTPIEENQLFQTDLYKTTSSALLDSGIQKQLQEVVEFLNKFSLKYENPNLKKFKENFYGRYEGNEIPLLEALDTETGIGYMGTDTSGVNILLDDIFISPVVQQSNNLNWNKQQEILHEKLLNAANKNEYEVIFTDDDIRAMNDYSIVLPDSLPIAFRIVGNNKLFFQNAGGSSAANLLGRFAHGDDTIHKIINEITLHEQNLNSEKILAEIVHLPESRVGNVLLRPVLRNYEIPYLGKSALPVENQIKLQDLMISIKSNKIILRSRKLNKEIIPRLSTAHNYSFNALPVYQLLCDLQTQYFEKSGFGFNWGVLSHNYKFLPRAEYKNVILARAKWQLPKSDFQILLNDKKDNYVNEIMEWRKLWNIPQHVVLVDGDNELLINFDDALSIKMFISSIKRRERIILEEFLFEIDNLLIKDKEGNGYTNEFIAILLKNNSQVNSSNVNITSALKNEIVNIQRDFNVGDEWLYYKFYCGIKTADKLLIEIIKPLCESLLQKKIIDKWFFIRYADPDNHLRIRFHLIDSDFTNQVIANFNQLTKPYLTQNLIWKIQTDTYKREIERYGASTIELAETLFCHDSEAILLTMSYAGNNEEYRWLIAMKSVDLLLSDFGLNVEEKIKFLSSLRDVFGKEFGMNKNLKVQLDSKFRSNKKKIEHIMRNSNESLNEPLNSLINIFHERTERNKPVVREIIALTPVKEQLYDYVRSYLHMSINRFFRSKQRMYELVIYDMLCKYYESALARSKKNKTSLAEQV